MVSMSPRRLGDDSEMMNRVLRRINNANDEELRPLWKNHHRVCTSEAVLLASKIADDPNNLVLQMMVTTEWRLQDAAFS